MACQTVVFVATLLLSLVFLLKIWKIFVILLWRPFALTRYFGKQGVKGPAYSILSGSLLQMKQMERMAGDIVLDTNSHDITHRVLPHYHIWSQLYGDTFLYWYGTQPRVCISDPDLAKQILSNKFGFFQKPKTRPSIQTLIGKGLVLVDGVDWVKHRRILNPAFSMDKLKVMIKRMAVCTISMLDEWKNQAIETEDGSKVIEMMKQFQELTADIIAHTAFGSSFAQGREAFSAQRKLQEYSAATNSDVFIPGTQYLPIPSNIQRWKLDRKIKKSIWSIIQSRLQSNPPNDSLERSYGDDLLGLMIEASEAVNKKDVPKLNMHEIIDECKTFFLAGHETTSSLLTWAVFLLSIHSDWQEKLRQEVIQECGMEIPDADMLAKLKMVNMVLLEVLRLYGPALELLRETSEDMKLGNLFIPKNTCVIIPVVKVHRSKDYWGEDANQFNPQRFINGVSRAAKHPNALLGFSMGPRVCIGQNFAMLEAKTILALILQRFSFCVSPEYKHAPANNLTLQPQYGLPIVVKPLQL